jgi:hypothetical protein
MLAFLVEAVEQQVRGAVHGVAHLPDTAEPGLFGTAREDRDLVLQRVEKTGVTDGRHVHRHFRCCGHGQRLNSCVGRWWWGTEYADRARGVPAPLKPVPRLGHTRVRTL